MFSPYIPLQENSPLDKIFTILHYVYKSKLGPNKTKGQVFLRYVYYNTAYLAAGAHGASCATHRRCEAARQARQT